MAEVNFLKSGEVVEASAFARGYIAAVEVEGMDFRDGWIEFDLSNGGGLLDIHIENTAVGWRAWAYRASWQGELNADLHSTDTSEFVRLV